jgi:hypothetical protein
MNPASSLLLPSHDIAPPISAANNTVPYSDTTHHDAIRGANTAGGTLDRPGNVSVGDATSRIRDFDDSICIDQVGSDPIRVAANKLSACDRDYRLDGDGYLRICQAIGAPHTYLKSLPTSLRVQIMQYHVDQRHHIKGGRADDAGTIVSRDGHFLAFGRDDLHSLTGFDVISTVVDAIGEPADTLEVHGLSFDDDSVSLEIVSPQVATEVRPNDLIRGGVRVVHSIVGTKATMILTFVLRLVCKNGLVHRECTGPRQTARTRRLPASSKHAKDRQLEQIHRLTRQSWSHTRRLLDSVQRLQEEPVTDPRNVFERYLRNGRLFSRNLVERLQAAWEVEESEPTAYGILNALTRVATHDLRITARQRRALAALAGVFAHKSSHICPRCYSVLSNVN